MAANKINVDGLLCGAERITNIEQGMANVQVLRRSAQDYGLTTCVLKVLCSLGSVLFCTGPSGVSISSVPSSLSR